MSPNAAAEAKPTRRSWLTWLIGTSLGAVAVSILYPLFRYVLPPPSTESQTGRVLAGRRSELPPGSGKTFRFGAKPGIVIATPGGEIRACECGSYGGNRRGAPLLYPIYG